MTFNENVRVQAEERQREHALAEDAAIVSYTQHPGDDAQAAQAITYAVSWRHDQSEDFIKHQGARLREKADGIVALAKALGVTPQEASRLETLANAAGMTVEEFAAQEASQKAARAAAATSAMKKHTPMPQSMRAALAALGSYAMLPADNEEAMTAIVHTVSGWSQLQADEFISEYGERLQAITGELHTLTAAADRSSAQQSSPVMRRS